MAGAGGCCCDPPCQLPTTTNDKPLHAHTLRHDHTHKCTAITITGFFFSGQHIYSSSNHCIVIAANVVVSVVVDFYVLPSPCIPQPLSFLFLPSLSTPLPDVRWPCQLLSIKITARVYRTSPLQCKSVWQQKVPSPSYCFKLPNRTGVIKKKSRKRSRKSSRSRRRRRRKRLQGGRWISKGNNLCGSLETRKQHKLSNRFENRHRSPTLRLNLFKNKTKQKQSKEKCLM